MKILNVEEMRAIEQASDARGHSYAAMMDMAGKAVAEAARALLVHGQGGHALVLVGPGNNGGDGLVAARYLLETGGNVVAVYIWRRNIKGDKNFQQLKRAARRRGLDILWADNDADYAHLREHLASTDLVIDALLGTGASRPIEGQLAEIMAVVRQGIAERRSAARAEDTAGLGGALQFPIGEAYTVGLKLPDREGAASDDLWGDDDDFEDDFDEDELGEISDLDFDEWLAEDEDEDEGEDMLRPNWPVAPVLAVDLPSGLNADTGELDPAAIPAQLTVTFAYPKWGQLEFPGAGACGILTVADIGVPEELAQPIQVELVRPADVQPLLPGRPADANKGTFGKAMIVAGSLNYTGAAYLCGSAAGRAGAGLVTLAVPAPLHAILAAAMPETTWLVLPDEHGTHSPAGLPALGEALGGTYRSLLLGPGLTTQPAAVAFVEQFLGSTLPRDAWRERLVADADGLNILAKLPDWAARLPGWTILTPHPGEMSRLTGLSIAEINGRRIETARRYAAEWGHIVLLKGAHTVIAAPDGRARVLPFAVPALATAGSGDVLAGAIVAMLAQGLAPFEAAVCGAYLHGHAGLIAQRELGPAGVVAGDITQRLPKALSQLWAVQGH